MKRAFALLLLTAGAAHASDGFEAVRCGGDVRAALLGRHMSDEPVVQIEKRHVALGLKDLGGDEISDELNSVSWRICAKEYVVVSDAKGVVRDVLAFPAHSKAAPEFSATECRANGKTVSGAIVGVMDAKRNVTAAWKIDTKTGRFSPLPAGLICRSPSIVTADGGP